MEAAIPGAVILASCFAAGVFDGKAEKPGKGKKAERKGGRNE